MKLRLKNFLIALPLLTATLSAAPLGFFAVLTGPSETPPNASPGTGYATVVIDASAHTMSVDVSFFGLVAGTTAAHIHVINGPGDGNTSDTAGPIATTTPTFAGFPSGVTSGSYSNLLDTTLAGSYNPSFVTNSGSIAAAESALFSAIIQGRAYFNIHSNTFPGGEIRGFFQPVPEPSTVAMVGVVLAGLGFRRARRSTVMN